MTQNVENKFLVLISTKIGSLCRFFWNIHFLVAFALKVHPLLKFWLETKIKLTSASGAVCVVHTDDLNQFIFGLSLTLSCIWGFLYLISYCKNVRYISSNETSSTLIKCPKYIRLTRTKELNFGIFDPLPPPCQYKTTQHPSSRQKLANPLPPPLYWHH